MTRKNITAFTALVSPYPPYLSVNDEGDGYVSIAVRSEAWEMDGRCGDVATIKMPVADFKTLVGDMVRWSKSP